jgi:uncharacterized protein (TIGR02453 family)
VTTTFQGWSAGVFDFYDQLEADNTRSFWTANRHIYDDEVKAPFEALSALVGDEFGPLKVFRPNRDVRFSKDKSPYKLAGAMTAGRLGGVYAQIDASGVRAGGGLYDPSRDQLARAREAIATKRGAAAALQKALDGLTSDGLELMGPSLKTAPRGYDPEHPQIELLRLQRYAALKRLPLKATQDDITKTWKTLKPLLAWIEKHAAR